MPDSSKSKVPHVNFAKASSQLRGPAVSDLCRGIEPLCIIPRFARHSFSLFSTLEGLARTHMAQHGPT